MPDVVGEDLVVAEAVLNGERDAVGRDDLRRDVRRPLGPRGLRRDDGGFDRGLTRPERRFRAVDLHELGAALERAGHDVSDRAHAQDRDPH